jgi:hypothetical protein
MFQYVVLDYFLKSLNGSLIYIIINDIYFFLCDYIIYFFQKLNLIVLFRFF